MVDLTKTFFKVDLIDKNLMLSKAVSKIDGLVRDNIKRNNILNPRAHQAWARTCRQYLMPVHGRDDVSCSILD
jgi:hypothetical protein